MQTITWRGKTRTYKEWEEATGIPSKILHDRHRKGWSVEEMLTTPKADGKGRPRKLIDNRHQVSQEIQSNLDVRNREAEQEEQDFQERKKLIQAGTFPQVHKTAKKVRTSSGVRFGT